ncbi:hypothetical protein D7X48_10800 [bacterium D16-50]|nr:hypothetical protein D7X48_10800 [bacterium D16-50]
MGDSCKPKVLYIELMDNNRGNLTVDLRYIRILSRITNLTVASPLGWYKSLDKKIKNIEYARRNSDAIIDYFRNGITNIRELFQLDKQFHFDFIFCASYETYLHALVPLGIPDTKRRVYICNHNNIDLMDRKKIKQMAFRLYKNKVQHIVFEEFMKMHLASKYHIAIENVHKLTYPIDEQCSSGEKIYDCVGISNSNNESWVRDMVALQRDTKLLTVHNLKVILRSKEITYEDSNLIVINGYLEKHEYENYISGAKMILLPYPDSFQHRMSGALVDALMNRVKVCGTLIPVFKHYEELYPHICKTINSCDDLIEALLRTSSQDEENQDFDKFMFDHSDATIEEEFKNMFCKNGAGK